MTANSSVSARPIPGASSDSGATGSSLSNPSIMNSLNEVPPSNLPAVDSMATAEEARKATTSPPIDPSKLNNMPAQLPTSPPTATEANASPFSPPLRSPPGDPSLPGLGSASGPTDSAYLDTGMPVEPSSHPTVAETGILSQSPGSNPGPKQGQLKRVEKKDSDEGIIKLGSLGGEGLKIKPPVTADQAHGPAFGQ